MIKKIKSIIDGNSIDVLKLKFKRKFAFKNLNIIKNNHSIPIIINNRNRLYDLRKLLDYLESKDFKQILIIDNQSTYLPLIEFYKDTKYEVHRLQTNLGYLSLWKINLFKKFKNHYYVYTDPDILPIPECPDDFLHYFKDCLEKNTHIEKIGFGLKIDDLPKNPTSQKIIEIENKFWKKKIDKYLYEAPIDTTFAMYKPNSFGGYWLKSLRTNFPYLARHLTWYDDRDHNEDKFYNQNIIKNSSFYANNRYTKY